MNNFCLNRNSVLFIMCAAIALPVKVFATKTNGRITLGGVAITERYKSDAFGSTSNDYLLGTSRFFYKISDLGDDRWELTSDLRDKHDFFGKLNKEDLLLQSKNDFQVRQLSARWINPKGAYSAQFGRFQLPEAGAVFVDGAEAEYRFSYLWRAGLFGGYNPKSVENSYLQLETDAQQAGGFVTYQSKDDGWYKNLYFSHGLVNQKYKSQEERSFFFHNLIYQWEEYSRVISYLNYDFVPSSKLQTMNFIYQQRWNTEYSTELNQLMIDVIEYRRVQGLLERLDASPYTETRAQVNRKNSARSDMGIELSSGQRQVDKLKREELTLGYSQTEVFLRNVDLRFKLGWRNNFTSKDNFAKIALGYFSRKWEYSIETDYEVNVNNDSTTTHPLTLELSLTNYYSKEIFLTGSFQRAADENVTIMSSFVKVGYRFGNQEIPPVRDGAAPRGAL